MHKLFDMLSVATLLAALALSSASPVHKRDDCEADTANDLSCVVYKFSGKCNGDTLLGYIAHSIQHRSTTSRSWDRWNL